MRALMLQQSEMLQSGECYRRCVLKVALLLCVNNQRRVRCGRCDYQVMLRVSKKKSKDFKFEGPAV